MLQGRILQIEKSAIFSGITDLQYCAQIVTIDAPVLIALADQWRQLGGDTVVAGQQAGELKWCQRWLGLIENGVVVHGSLVGRCDAEGACAAPRAEDDSGCDEHLRINPPAQDA
jgi:hypothetical protein